MVSQWNSSEIFPRIHHIAALQTSPRVHVKMSEAPEDFTGRIIFHVDVPTTSHGDLKTMNRNANWGSKLRFLFMREDFHQEDGHSSDLDQKRSGNSTHDSQPPGEWDRVAEVMMIKFSESGRPVFRATSPLSRGTLKSKGGGKLSFQLLPMGRRLKLFFAQLFLSISSVSTEQSQMCVRNTELVKQDQEDPCWQDNLTHCSSQQVRWWKHLHLRPMILRKKIYCKSYQERVERLSQQNRVIKFCTDAGFLTTVDVGQYFMTKRHWRILTIYRVSGLSWVSTFCQEMENHLTRKVWIRGSTKNWARIGSHNQQPTR